MVPCCQKETLCYALTRILLVAVVAVLATCNDAAQLAGAIRAPGCLDHSLALPAPGAAERTSMLASHLASRGATYTLQELQVGTTPFIAAITVQPSSRFCKPVVYKMVMCFWQPLRQQVAVNHLDQQMLMASVTSHSSQSPVETKGDICKISDCDIRTRP